MTYVSKFDLWGPGGNSVVALPPSPGDVLVVTMMFGKRVSLAPIAEYAERVHFAKCFIRRARHTRPIVIKILPLTLIEAQSMGFAPRDVFDDMTPEQLAEWRQLIVSTCFEAMCESNEPAVRAEAHKLLVDMGAITT